MVTTPTIGQTSWGQPLNDALNDLQTQIDGKYSSAGGALTGGITTDLAVRSAFLKTTSTTEHAVTIYQAGTSGTDTASALNLISDNPFTSAVQITSSENARGAVKITHRNDSGSASGDASAAAISIDLTQDGAGGTACQGIFVTSTDGGTTGNPITIRHNGRDDFVVKGTGRTGVGMAIGEAPESQLEVKQTDTSTVGVAINGIAAGAALLQVKPSSGTATLEVANSGAIVHRALSFYTNSLQLGSTSSDLGGATGSVISMKNAAADPGSNPTGGVIIYASGGRLKIRQPDGTDEFVALTAV
jgi:hypothetical protein